MPHLSPQTLTLAEQRAILRATVPNLRDHLIYSLALATGLRLAEIVGLNVGDVYVPNGTPRTRIRLRPELVKGGLALRVTCGVRTRPPVRCVPTRTVTYLPDRSLQPTASFCD